MFENERDPTLPDWAERRAVGYRLEPMRQLYTKDGAKTGNATLYRIAHVDYTGPKDVIPAYLVVTDAGSWSTLNHEEILELYTPGSFILRALPNPQAYVDKRSRNPGD